MQSRLSAPYVIAISQIEAPSRRISNLSNTTPMWLPYCPTVTRFKNHLSLLHPINCYRQHPFLASVLRYLRYRLSGFLGKGVLFATFFYQYRRLYRDFGRGTLLMRWIWNQSKKLKSTFKHVSKGADGTLRQPRGLDGNIDDLHLETGNCSGVRNSHRLSRYCHMASPTVILCTMILRRVVVAILIRTKERIMEFPASRQGRLCLCVGTV